VAEIHRVPELVKQHISNALRPEAFVVVEEGTDGCHPARQNGTGAPRAAESNDLALHHAPAVVLLGENPSDPETPQMLVEPRKTIVHSCVLEAKARGVRDALETLAHQLQSIGRPAGLPNLEGDRLT